MQLSSGLPGRFGLVRRSASHADGARLRSAGQVAVRGHGVRHVGGFRRPLVHGVHPEFVHDQRRPLLGHHAAIGLRRQKDTCQNVLLRRPRLDLFGLHFTAAAPRPRQRTRTTG